MIRLVRPSPRALRLHLDGVTPAILLRQIAASSRSRRHE